jgi:hypothetical protein
MTRTCSKCNVLKPITDFVSLKYSPGTQALNEIYLNCPSGYHVDHIMPLQGKSICGLHVPWNLQYLLPLDNIKKGNRLPSEGAISQSFSALVGTPTKDQILLM